MSPRRLSRLLFGPEAETQLPAPASVAVQVEQAWNDDQGGRLGGVIAALPALLQAAQELEDRAARCGDDRSDCWAVSARTHHLAATTLAKIGESDISWLAAERAMRAADESDDPLVLASAAQSGTHALLANGRYDDALELGDTAATWLSSQVTENDPAALSLLGMIHLRAAVAAARHQDRPTATGLLDRAETGTGRTYPTSESTDVGLFVSSEQFRIALQGALDRAIKELSPEGASEVSRAYRR
jgi:hypothetical protein